MRSRESRARFSPRPPRASAASESSLNLRGRRRSRHGLASSLTHTSDPLRRETAALSPHARSGPSRRLKRPYNPVAEALAMHSHPSGCRFYTPTPPHLRIRAVRTV
ncbi:hypothetical protein PsYK624_089180 [Phanerochaete sordida]|uniref:Uncharacterized protein n=1 Tax=Phanerochaete sordida TaxID=48140 RepID=A0A9P3GDK7_9APHY|nr:hypothetical protein PsYK624_089180 [Phanerochaete sordida]